MIPQLDPNRYDACPEYNDWLDEQSGPLSILGFQPRPSEVLFTMSPDTYQAAFPDFIQQRESDIKERVWAEYPSPIAYYFYRFENGFDSELQRLLFLRDTWESIIDILHAIAVAEVRHSGISLCAPLKFANLLSEKYNDRLLNIEEIINQLKSAGITSLISQIVSSPILQEIRELNQSRNALSHSATQSELQAQKWVTDCLEDVISILGSLNGLAEIQICKYVGQHDMTTLRCEIFKGHSSTRTIRQIPITKPQVQEYGRYFQNGHILLLSRTLILSLRPFIHFRGDITGHTTRLCVFRRRANRRIEYEVVGDAERHQEDQLLFADELNELRKQFNLEPD